MNNDPRDKRFFALKRKDRSQLSKDEIEELIDHCAKVLQYGLDKKSRRSWSRFRDKLTDLL